MQFPTWHRWAGGEGPASFYRLPRNTANRSGGQRWNGQSSGDAILLHSWNGRHGVGPIITQSSGRSAASRCSAPQFMHFLHGAGISGCRGTLRGRRWTRAVQAKHCEAATLLLLTTRVASTRMAPDLPNHWRLSHCMQMHVGIRKECSLALSPTAKHDGRRPVTPPAKGEGNGKAGKPPSICLETAPKASCKPVYSSALGE